MNLDDLHAKLSKNKSYRKAYDALGDSVALGLMIKGAREGAKLSMMELASETETSVRDVASIETAEPDVSPDALSVIVERLSGELLSRGVDARSLIRPGAKDRLAAEAKRRTDEAARQRAAMDPRPGINLGAGRRIMGAGEPIGTDREIGVPREEEEEA